MAGGAVAKLQVHPAFGNQTEGFIKGSYAVYLTERHLHMVRQHLQGRPGQILITTPQFMHDRNDISLFRGIALDEFMKLLRRFLFTQLRRHGTNPPLCPPFPNIMGRTGSASIRSNQILSINFSIRVPFPPTAAGLFRIGLGYGSISFPIKPCLLGVFLLYTI